MKTLKTENTENRKTLENDLIIRETLDGQQQAVKTTVRSKSPRSPRPGDGGERRPAKTKPKNDRFLWGIYLALLMVSVVELFSASSSEVTGGNVYNPLIRHAIFLGLGLLMVLGLQRTHYGYISRYAWIFAVLSLGLLVLSSTIGININGAQRALRFAGVTIQPAEIVKLAIVVILSSIMAKNQRPGDVANKGVVQVAVVVAIFSALTWRNGLTNMILIMLVSVSMFMIGGIKLRKLFIVGAIYAVLGLCGGYINYSDKGEDAFDRAQTTAVAQPGAQQDLRSVDRTGTQKSRIARHLKGTHPDDPIDDMNRQVIFSKMAQAHGGIIGQGPGNSRENARLPLAFSDYIYSIIVEDTGLVGGIALMVLYLLLVGRAGAVAYKCSRALPAFLILGCAVLIVLQALVHMAIVTEVFPVSGQPLPFISKGGTSILVMSAAMGIMMSVSRFAVRSGDKQQLKAEARELPEELHTANAATM